MRRRSCLPPVPILIPPPPLRLDALTEEQRARFDSLPPDLQADLVGRLPGSRPSPNMTGHLLQGGERASRPSGPFPTLDRLGLEELALSSRPSPNVSG
jgi:hypothetical protein